MYVCMYVCVYIYIYICEDLSRGNLEASKAIIPQALWSHKMTSNNAPLVVKYFLTFLDIFFWCTKFFSKQSWGSRFETRHGVSHLADTLQWLTGQRLRRNLPWPAQPHTKDTMMLGQHRWTPIATALCETSQTYTASNYCKDVNNIAEAILHSWLGSFLVIPTTNTCHIILSNWGSIEIWEGGINYIYIYMILWYKRGF